MSVALYMDENVPAAITDALRRRGVEILTAQEDGMRGSADVALLERATALERVVFTMDDDFLREAVRRLRTGTPFAGVIYAHQLRVSIGRCVADLELIALASDPRDVQNEVQYLPLD